MTKYDCTLVVVAKYDNTTTEDDWCEIEASGIREARQQAREYYDEIIWPGKFWSPCGRWLALPPYHDEGHLVPGLLCELQVVAAK